MKAKPFLDPKFRKLCEDTVKADVFGPGCRFGPLWPSLRHAGSSRMEAHRLRAARASRGAAGVRGFLDKVVDFLDILKEGKVIMLLGHAWYGVRFGIAASLSGPRARGRRRSGDPWKWH